MDDKKHLVVVSSAMQPNSGANILNVQTFTSGHGIQLQSNDPVLPTINNTLPLRNITTHGSHTGPIANMIADMQGRFAQLDRTQRRQLLEWMMTNLDGGDLVNRMQTTSTTHEETNPIVPGLNIQQQPTLQQPTQQQVQSYFRGDALQNFTTIAPIPWSGTKLEGLPGSEVLSISVPGMNFETTSTSVPNVNYVPLVASHSTSSVTYATPLYSAEISVEDQASYPHQSARQNNMAGVTGLPQGARVIAEATVNSRDGTIEIPGNTNMSNALTNEMLDSNIVSVANTIMLGGDNNPIDHSANEYQSLIVIKTVDGNEQNDDNGGSSHNMIENEQSKHENENISENTSVDRSRGFIRGKKRKQRRRSPCAECKRYFHLTLDETKKVRIWREKSHICQTCNKIFRTRAHLKVHERIHSGIKPYMCSVCNKGFAQSSAAKAHTLLHAMPKPFACPVCGKAVTTKGNLKLHMALHSGHKPHKCNYCGKTFPRKSNLDQHVLVHTGEKPYSCQYCGKKFRTITSKTTHERIHTGEKPFTCKYCGKSFSDKRNLSSHERIHTGGYPCDVCGKHFSDRRRLKSHQCPGQQEQHITQLQ